MAIGIFLTGHQSQCTEFNNKNKEQNQRHSEAIGLFHLEVQWMKGGRRNAAAADGTPGWCESVSVWKQMLEGRKEFQFSCCALL